MGKPILIYHDGQKSLIDSDLIYEPVFIAGVGYGVKTQPHILSSLKGVVVELDTMSENEDKDEKEEAGN